MEIIVEGIPNKKYRKINLFTRIKDKLINWMNNMSIWLYKNKEIIVVVTPLISIAIKSICKTIGKIVESNDNRIRANRSIYDRSYGHYWILKHEPTTQEWKEIHRRKSSGESLCDILTSMCLL